MAKHEGGREHRDVRLSQRLDIDVYVRMRGDPAMMAELGGLLPREGIEAKSTLP